jgi:hypothetical protein
MSPIRSQGSSARTIAAASPEEMGRLDRAFAAVAANEKAARIDQLALSLRHAIWASPGEFIARHPIKFTPDHPHFGHAARVAQMLSGLNPDDMLEVRLVPDEPPEPVSPDMAPASPASTMIGVLVLLRTGRWHEVPNLSLSRLCDAWIDARGL